MLICSLASILLCLFVISRSAPHYTARPEGHSHLFSFRSLPPQYLQRSCGMPRSLVGNSLAVKEQNTLVVIISNTTK